MYLLDTGVVAELRQPQPHRSVLGWITRVPADRIFLSAVTVGQIQAGIERARARNPRKAHELEVWLEQVIASHAVLPMDAAAFRELARLQRRRSRGQPEQAMIAATAVVHRLTVATRNVRDFRLLGVPFLNPFEA